jgi:hypothetical protein
MKKINQVNSFFLPLPNLIAPKMMALPFPRAPPPSNLFPCTSSIMPVYFWLVVESKTSIGGHLRPQSIFLNFIFVDQLNGQNDGAVTPRTFQPSRTPSPIDNPPWMPTSIRLLHIFRKQRPPKANAPPIYLFFDMD